MVVGWFKKLKKSLSKSSDKISGGIKKILKSKRDYKKKTKGDSCPS